MKWVIPEFYRMILTFLFKLKFKNKIKPKSDVGFDSNKIKNPIGLLRIRVQLAPAISMWTKGESYWTFLWLGGCSPYPLRRFQMPKRKLENVPIADESITANVEKARIGVFKVRCDQVRTKWLFGVSKNRPLEPSRVNVILKAFKRKNPGSYKRTTPHWLSCQTQRLG